MKDKHKTEVKFYKDSFGVFAVFPNLVADYDGNITSYAHIGQHSAMCPEYIEITKSKEALEDEYKPLKEELESIGYNLKVAKWKESGYYFFMACQKSLV